MDGQPGQDDGEGAGPDRDPAPDPSRPVRDPRLAGFVHDESRPDPAPSSGLAVLIDGLSGPGRRCPGATDDELIGLLRAWAALESWAAAAKLGLVREMMRREGPPSPGSDHGDLPECWSPSLRYELAGALACSTQSADGTASLAWELAARLPAIGARLQDGTLTQGKAKAVTDTFEQLTDADAATAEAMIADQLAGKTYTQVLRLAEQAALTVDPALAERRREQAQKRDARVSFFREQAGTAALSGRDLPPDEALAAMAAVNARADQYKESGAFGDTPMDVLRAYAYLDLINDRPADHRIMTAEPQDDAGKVPPDQPDQPDPPDPRETEDDIEGDPDDCSCTDCDGSCLVGDYDLDPDDEDDEPGDGSDGDGYGPSGSGPYPCGPGPAPGAPPAGQPRPRPPEDLIVPLTTLLGLGERPGEIHGFGLLDPALARQLAAAATASPTTEICVTVTSAEGYAIGHGCARPARTPPRARPAQPRPPQPGPAATPAPLPARLNLTIPATALPATALPALARPPGNTHPWAFTSHRKQAGTPGGFGTWTLTLPDGRQLTIRLDPVPTYSCDHRYESHGYQPSDRLRHLVQIRDGTCTFPPCNRHAHDSDFEHAIPYDQGGKTCTCNAGARSRACHKIKQSPGWQVTQPRPGWHRWETPAGRVYAQEPKRYPA